MRRALIWIGIFGVMAAIAAPKVIPRWRTKPAAPLITPGGSKSPDASAALRVEAFALAPTSLSETITSTGSLRADEGVELQAETNGKIVSINFTEGARVRRGDLLIKLNDAELRATLQRAAYRRDLAETKERRLAQLIETKSVNQQDYDVALSELSVQRAEVSLVEAQLAKLEIRAPFDGVVGLRFVSEGALVNATTRVATLQRLEKLKIDFSVPEKYAARIRTGSAISFSVAGGEHRAQGEIYAFEPRIDPTTRTVLVRAICPNPGGRLLPGAFANVEVVLAEMSDAIVVPALAVIPGLNEKNVFIVSEGKAVRRAVETGMRTESTVQIVSGLKVGDVVITSGLQQLRAGLPVNAILNPAARTVVPEKQPTSMGKKVTASSAQ